MKRPRQHIIDSLGEAQVRSIFEPLGWTVTKIDPDYGIDFEIEVFDDAESTGASFKVQLKSSEKTQYQNQETTFLSRLNARI